MVAFSNFLPIGYDPVQDGITMPHCAALGCNFQSKGNKGTDVSLHVFPNDKKLRKQWEDACGRTELPKDPRLCSRHFNPDAFEAFNRPQLLKDLTGSSGCKRRLKPDAVPTVFPDRESQCSGMSSENREKKREPKQTLDPHITGVSPSQDSVNASSVLSVTSPNPDPQVRPFPEAGFYHLATRAAVNLTVLLKKAHNSVQARPRGQGGQSIEALWYNLSSYSLPVLRHTPVQFPTQL